TETGTAEAAERVVGCSRAGPNALGTEHVVPATTLGVAQGVVGEGDLLEPLLGRRIGIGVGMELTSQPPVGPLQLLVTGARLDTQKLVVVSGHRWLSLPSGGRQAAC